jgi:hypothetical protein
MYNPAFEAAQKWKEDYADLRLSYDRSALDAAIAAFVRVELADDARGADEETGYTLLCIAFVALHKRGAITPIRPFSSEGEEQLDELIRNFNVVSGPPVEDETLTMKEQVLFDWDHIEMKKFKENWKNPAYKAAYDQLIAEGTIK